MSSAGQSSSPSPGDAGWTDGPAAGHQYAKKVREGEGEGDYCQCKHIKICTEIIEGIHC